jgi:hypothetical protein
MQALALRTHAKYYRAFEASGVAGVINDVLKQIDGADDSLQQALNNAMPLNAASPDA